MKSIYLAGKVAKNDWRHDVCEGLDAACNEQGYQMQSGIAGVPSWGSYNVTVLGAWRYAGPYFSACDHGCAHAGLEGHAVTGGCIDSATASGRWNHGTDYRPWIHAQCLEAIRSCDLFFAWLDDPTAYGTLVEIGYAKALGKTVIVALPKTEQYQHHPDSELDELWFATERTVREYVDSPVEALQRGVARVQMESARTDSPIEAAFWSAYQRISDRLPSLDGITTQHTVGRYRLDFAIPAHKIAIELDGYEHHSSRDQFTRDRARQRELEQQGWRFIRFSGREVNADPTACVREAARLASSIIGTPDPVAA